MKKEIDLTGLDTQYILLEKDGVGFAVIKLASKQWGGRYTNQYIITAVCDAVRDEDGIVDITSFLLTQDGLTICADSVEWNYGVRRMWVYE